MSETLEAVRSAPRTVRYDKGRHLRAKIGFVLLAMEQTVEDDVFKIAPPGVGIHFNRMQMSNTATVDTLKSMAPGIEIQPHIKVTVEALSVGIPPGREKSQPSTAGKTLFILSISNRNNQYQKNYTNRLIKLSQKKSLSCG